MKFVIKPMDRNFRWAVIDENNAVLKRGETFYLPHVWLIQRLEENIDATWIDCGYRTAEVMEACQKYGWIPIKGRTGKHGSVFGKELAIIEEATKGV